MGIIIILKEGVLRSRVWPLIIIGQLFTLIAIQCARGNMAHSYMYSKVSNLQSSLCQMNNQI